MKAFAHEVCTSCTTNATKAFRFASGSGPSATSFPVAAGCAGRFGVGMPNPVPLDPPPRKTNSRTTMTPTMPRPPAPFPMAPPGNCMPPWGLWPRRSSSPESSVPPLRQRIRPPGRARSLMAARRRPHAAIHSFRARSRSREPARLGARPGRSGPRAGRRRRGRMVRARVGAGARSRPARARRRRPARGPVPHRRGRRSAGRGVLPAAQPRAEAPGRGHLHARRPSSSR